MISARFKTLMTTSCVFAAIAVAGITRIDRASLVSEATSFPVANAAMISTGGTIKNSGEQGGQQSLRSEDGLFYVTAKVNGKPLRFLVDTGASVVVLTAADARAAGISPAPAHYSANVETVGGSAQMAWTTLDHLVIAGRDVKDLRAAVVQSGLGVSLLGQNALSKLEAVRIEGDQLRLY